MHLLVGSIKVSISFTTCALQERLFDGKLVRLVLRRISEFNCSSAGGGLQLIKMDMIINMQIYGDRYSWFGMRLRMLWEPSATFFQAS